VCYLLARPSDGVTKYVINEDTFQKEVHDKHPIALGGDPINKANKVLVPAAQHPEICNFWNKVCHEVRSQSQGKG
jgi:hypothetical protein